MKTEFIVLNQERNVTLTCLLQEVKGEFRFEKRPAMIVIPGGGYAMCSDREGDAVATAYAAAGYQTFVLRYTVKSKGGWPLPLQDYEQAYNLIKSKQEEWGVDMGKVSVVGFSAGAHLAGCAATISSCKPAAAVLVYPPSLGDILDMCQPNLPRIHEVIDDNTCPCFLVACRDDTAVDIKNNLTIQMALAENDIPFESHIYSYGGHGFSTALPWIYYAAISENAKNWVKDSINWLNDTIGTLTYNGFLAPNIHVGKSGDKREKLSINCSWAHMEKQSEEVKGILKPMYDAIQAYAKANGYNYNNLLFAIGKTKISELMEVMGISSEVIADINKKLEKIDNKR